MGILFLVLLTIYILYVYIFHHIPMFIHFFDSGVNFDSKGTLYVPKDDFYSHPLTIIFGHLITIFLSWQIVTQTEIHIPGYWLIFLILFFFCYPFLISIFAVFPFTFLWVGIFGFFQNIKDIFMLITFKKSFKDFF